MEPAVRYYLFLACAGLLTLGLAVFEKGGLFALPVVVFGAIGIVPSLLPPRTVWARLARKIPAHAMPPLVLLWLVVVEILFGYGSRRDRGVFNFSDLLTCAGLLAYLAGQYRLLGLRFQAVPADIRPRTDRTGGDERETRPESLTSPQNLK